ncbi:Cyclin-Dependent Kinase 13 [Manis pentadactyla]|nr:Cyclin-Dependent Kinase 13 [Manis pentadactyla]
MQLSPETRSPSPSDDARRRNRKWGGGEQLEQTGRCCCQGDRWASAASLRSGLQRLKSFISQAVWSY